MKITEPGVLAESNVYFHTPSEMAQRLYFYLRCTGRYTCDGSYEVNRLNYDSFLIIYVQHGSGYVYQGGKRLPLQEGAFILLDCYKPHRYGTDTGWEILWIHFDGSSARDYYQHIVSTRGSIYLLSNPYRASHSLDKIYRMYHHEKRAVEAMISLNILNVLTEFILFDSAGEESTENAAHLDELLLYITENIEQPLSVEMMAKRIALSPFYFTRVFKKEIGQSPHEYLINARVNRARFYLKTTDLPLKEIAYRCGFSNESSLCTTFKRLSDCTPMEYRNSGRHEKGMES